MSQTTEEFFTVRCQVADMKNLYVSRNPPFWSSNMTRLIMRFDCFDPDVISSIFHSCSFGVSVCQLRGNDVTNSSLALCDVCAVPHIQYLL